MPLTKYYSLADPMIDHLDTVMLTAKDPFISSRYIGLVSIAAVTVYELCIKDIFGTLAILSIKCLEYLSIALLNALMVASSLKILKGIIYLNSVMSM